MKSFNRDTVLTVLERLGELASEEGVQLECCVYGGALMMLAYDAKISTKDVDAVIRPREEGLRLAGKVAQEQGLPEDWLNDQVKQFVAPHEELRELPLEFKGIQLTSPTAGYLLAMKALACRTRLPGYGGDLNDLAFLIRKMDITSVETIQEAVDRYYPDDVLPEVHRATLQELIAEVWA